MTDLDPKGALAAIIEARRQKQAEIAEIDAVIAEAAPKQPIIPFEPIPVSEPKKTGWKTTEFWLPLIMAVIAFACEKAGLSDLATILGVGSAGSATSYGVSRGMVKR